MSFELEYGNDRPGGRSFFLLGVRWATLPALRATLPTVVPTDSRALSCPPIGALPRNRLASSATGSASAISPYAGEALGTGDADCHTSDIGHWFAMTGFFMKCGVSPDGRTGASAPTNDTRICASPDGGVRAPRPTHLSIKGCTKYVESSHTNTIEP